MIGTALSSRRRRQTSRPSRPGSMRSRMTRSGGCSAARYRADRPSSAATTMKPAAARYWQSTSRMPASSSTTSTRRRGSCATLAAVTVSPVKRILADTFDLVRRLPDDCTRAMLQKAYMRWCRWPAPVPCGVFARSDGPATIAPDGVRRPGWAVLSRWLPRAAGRQPSATELGAYGKRRGRGQRGCAPFLDDLAQRRQVGFLGGWRDDIAGAPAGRPECNMWGREILPAPHVVVVSPQGLEP